VAIGWLGQLTDPKKLSLESFQLGPSPISRRAAFRRGLKMSAKKKRLEMWRNVSEWFLRLASPVSKLSLKAAKLVAKK
jgi:hypothetical protein